MLTNPGLKALTRLANLAPHQLFRFAMDGDKQPKNAMPKEVKAWESREKGSLRAILAAYAHVIPLIRTYKRLTIADLQEIHRLCMTDVTTAFPPKPGKLRMVQSGSFGLTRKTCTEAGIDEMISEFDSRYSWFLFTLRDDKPAVRKLHLTHSIFCGPGFRVTTYDGGFTSQQYRDQHALIRTFGLDPAEPTPEFTELKELFEANLSTLVNKVLADLYDVLDETLDTDTILLEIARALQYLERVHIFFDGNCRTLCMVALNVLLMQKGFMPAIIDNPNKFDGHSILELVELIKEGMNTASELFAYVEQRHRNPHMYPRQKRWEVHPNQRAEVCRYAGQLINTLAPTPPQASARLFDKPEKVAAAIANPEKKRVWRP